MGKPWSEAGSMPLDDIREFVNKLSFPSGYGALTPLVLPEDVDEDDIGQCFNCDTWVSSGGFCYDCRVYVCGKCSVPRNVAITKVNHEAGDHLDEAEDA